jgi:hypothetical protein
MKTPLIAIGLAATIGTAVALAALPAAAATCQEMFSKAEQMVGGRGNVDNRVTVYSMAVNSYNMCMKATSMADGNERMAMMKNAEQEFEKTYSFIRRVE